MVAAPVALAQGLPLEYPDPPGLQPGVPVELRLETAARSFAVWAGAPIDFDTPTPRGDAVFLRATASVKGPGRFVFRISATNGISPWRLGLVDPLPAVRDDPDAKAPTPLHSPVAVDGWVPANGARRFTVALKRGEKITVEAVARRLGSMLDPRLRILDDKGRVLATVDDVPGMERDAWIVFAAPATAAYTVEISDALGDGGLKHRFRLRVHGGPPELFPYLPVRDTVGRATPAFPVFDSPGTNVVLEIPSTVRARFDRPGIPLGYKFKTGQGGSMRVELRTRGLGSRADVGARIVGPAGKVLAESDASKGDDGTLDYTFKDAGETRLELLELSRGAGAGYEFEFDLLPGGPDFSASADKETLELTPEGSGEIKVTLARRGHEGAVRIGAPDLPAGYRLENPVIEEKKKEGTVKIVAGEGAVPGSMRFLHLVASAEIAGKTVEVPVRTRIALRAAWPELLVPPPGLDGVFTIGVKSK